MKLQILAALAAGTLAAPAMAGFINEFHYDNTGTDEGEFIEVVLSPGENAADFDIHLYNGSDSQYYSDSGTLGFDIFNLATDFVFHGILGDGNAYYSLSLPSNGLQNGGADGIGLTMNGAPVEFLSYEGTLTGSGGPFDGVESTNIGVTQGSGTSVGSSLQLIAGEWVATDGFNTQGAINAVPAPGALALLGLAGVASRRRRRA